MSVRDAVIMWDAPAVLKDIQLPTHGLAWVGDPLYDGTVAGAIRTFRTLDASQQRRIEMLIEPGVISGSAATIVTYDSLVEIANRSDVPPASPDTSTD
jgi:hypothetical protein